MLVGCLIKGTKLRKVVSLCLVVAIGFSASFYSFGALRANNLPSNIVNSPLTKLLPVSLLPIVKEQENLPLLKGFTFDSQTPQSIRFYLHNPNKKSYSDKDITRLIKYFFAAVALPDDKLWVNLSPYEKERILPDELAQLDLGKDMLLEDYLLKQLTTSLTNPNTPQGKKFWQDVYQSAYKIAQTTKIPINNFYKVWVVPDKAVVGVYKNTAYVKEASLKVMMETDYHNSTMQQGKGLISPVPDRHNLRTQGATSAKVRDPALHNSVYSGIPLDNRNNKVRKINNQAKGIFKRELLPIIESQVNESITFAPLRQLYSAIILAAYFKEKLKSDIYYKHYVNQKKTSAIKLDNPKVKEVIYQSYLRSFRQGAYNQVIPSRTEKEEARRYFSGGFSLAVSPIKTQESASSMLTVVKGNDVVDLKVSPGEIYGSFNLFSKVTKYLAERVVTLWVIMISLPKNFYGKKNEVVSTQEMISPPSMPLSLPAPDSVRLGDENEALFFLAAAQGFISQASGRGISDEPKEKLVRAASKQLGHAFSKSMDSLDVAFNCDLATAYFQVAQLTNNRDFSQALFNQGEQALLRIVSLEGLSKGQIGKITETINIIKDGETRKPFISRFINKVLAITQKSNFPISGYLLVSVLYEQIKEINRAYHTVIIALKAQFSFYQAGRVSYNLQLKNLGAINQAFQRKKEIETKSRTITAQPVLDNLAGYVSLLEIVECELKQVSASEAILAIASLVTSFVEDVKRLEGDKQKFNVLQSLVDKKIEEVMAYLAPAQQVKEVDLETKEDLLFTKETPLEEDLESTRQSFLNPDDPTEDFLVTQEGFPADFLDSSKAAPIYRGIEKGKRYQCVANGVNIRLDVFTPGFLPAAQHVLTYYLQFKNSQISIEEKTSDLESVVFQIKTSVGEFTVRVFTGNDAKSRYQRAVKIEKLIRQRTLGQEMSALDKHFTYPLASERDSNVAGSQYYILPIQTIENAQALDVFLENKALSLSQCFEIAGQLIETITLLHRINILHNGLTLQNIFVQLENGHPVVKITDLSLALDVNNQEALYRQDIFKLGVILAELVCQREFDPANMSEITAELLQVEKLSAIAMLALDMIRKRGDQFGIFASMVQIWDYFRLMQTEPKETDPEQNKMDFFKRIIGSKQCPNNLWQWVTILQRYFSVSLPFAQLGEEVQSQFLVVLARSLFDKKLSQENLEALLDLYFNAYPFAAFQERTRQSFAIQILDVVLSMEKENNLSVEFIRCAIEKLYAQKEEKEALPLIQSFVLDLLSCKGVRFDVVVGALLDTYLNNFSIGGRAITLEFMRSLFFDQRQGLFVRARGQQKNDALNLIFNRLQNSANQQKVSYLFYRFLHDFVKTPEQRFPYLTRFRSAAQDSINLWAQEYCYFVEAMFAQGKPPAAVLYHLKQKIYFAYAKIGDKVPQQYQVQQVGSQWKVLPMSVVNQETLSGQESPLRADKVFSEKVLKKYVGVFAPVVTAYERVFHRQKGLTFTQELGGYLSTCGAEIFLDDIEEILAALRDNQQFQSVLPDILEYRSADSLRTQEIYNHWVLEVLLSIGDRQYTQELLEGLTGIYFHLSQEAQEGKEYLGKCVKKINSVLSKLAQDKTGVVITTIATRIGSAQDVGVGENRRVSVLAFSLLLPLLKQANKDVKRTVIDQLGNSWLGWVLSALYFQNEEYTQAELKDFIFLGQGGEGMTYKMSFIEHGEEQEKVLKVYYRDRQDSFAREKTGLEYFANGHPELISQGLVPQYSLRFTSDSCLLLAMDAAEEAKDLDVLLRERYLNKQKVNLAQALRWINQIVAGLKSLHEKGVYHCDLKPGNMLEVMAGQIMFIDWGLRFLFRQETETESYAVGRSGTLAYLPDKQMAFFRNDPRRDTDALQPLFFNLLFGYKQTEDGTWLVGFDSFQNREFNPYELRKAWLEDLSRLAIAEIIPVSNPGQLVSKQKQLQKHLKELGLLFWYMAKPLWEKYIDNGVIYVYQERQGLTDIVREHLVRNKQACISQEELDKFKDKYDTLEKQRAALAKITRDIEITLGVRRPEGIVGKIGGTAEYFVGQAKEQGKGFLAFLSRFFSRSEKQTDDRDLRTFGEESAPLVPEVKIVESPSVPTGVEEVTNVDGNIIPPASFSSGGKLLMPGGLDLTRQALNLKVEETVKDKDLKHGDSLPGTISVDYSAWENLERLYFKVLNVIPAEKVEINF